MRRSFAHPALLLRQLWLIAAFAGIFSTRYFWPALLCMGLLLVHQHRRIFALGRCSAGLFILGLFLSFGAGAFYANLRYAAPLPVPQWALAAASPTARHFALEQELAARKEKAKFVWDAADNRIYDDGSAIGRDGVYRKGLRVRAKVASVEARPDRELRITLEDIRPLDFAAPPYAGKLSFTWASPLTPEAELPLADDTPAYFRRNVACVRLGSRPLPGQELELTLRLRKAGGLRNFGLWNIESYWADQGVTTRAWALGGEPEVLAGEVAGLRCQMAGWRENLRQEVLRALPREPLLRDGPAGSVLDESAIRVVVEDGLARRPEALPKASVGENPFTVIRDANAHPPLRPDISPGIPPGAPPEISYAAPPDSQATTPARITDGAALIPALLFGDKYLMNSHDAELFARATLAHSLALSGLHLGYAAALGYFAVFVLYRLRPSLARRMPRRKAALLGGALPALAYLWLGGAPPSLVRSFLMLAFAGWALFRQRPPVLADALVWAVAVILLWNPLAAFDLRLQLSAMCIAALALAQPLFSRVYSVLGGPGFLRRTARGGALLFLSSIVIQIALAPLLIKSFGLYGLSAPLNLLWLPVLGLVVMPCAFLGLICTALHIPADGFFFYLAALPCEWLLNLLRYLDGAGRLPVAFPLRPHWASMIGFWFALLLLPRLIARRENILQNAPAFFIALALVFGPPALPEPGGVQMRVLDVGQAQAILFEWNGKRLLLDAGGSSSPRFDVGREVVAASLAQNRGPGLDYVFVSHLDQDHAGGLEFSLRNIKIGYYADIGEAPAKPLAGKILGLLAERGLERHILRAGDELRLDDDFTIQVLHPDLPRDAAPADGNKNSLVLRAVWKGRPLAVVCGDVDKAALHNILRRYPDEALRADVLVVAHHGSAASLEPFFYRAASPRMAVASAGYGNSWNFPSAEVKNELLAQSIPLLSTASSGQIALRWAKPEDSPQVATARNGPLLVGDVEKQD